LRLSANGSRRCPKSSGARKYGAGLSSCSPNSSGATLTTIADTATGVVQSRIDAILFPDGVNGSPLEKRAVAGIGEGEITTFAELALRTAAPASCIWPGIHRCTLVTSSHRGKCGKQSAMYLPEASNEVTGDSDSLVPYVRDDPSARYAGDLRISITVFRRKVITI
jgi:hypothetical protein